MDLTITAIETEQIRVPLVRTYRGSHYKMTHRSTIITRIFTAAGLVGEAYAGDEDAGLAEIDQIIHEEIAPKILGEDGSAIERLWEIARPATWDILRDRRLGLVATASSILLFGIFMPVLFQLRSTNFGVDIEIGFR